MTTTLLEGDYFTSTKYYQYNFMAMPTMENMASLVNRSWTNLDYQDSKEIHKGLRNHWIWTSNGNLYVPNKGVYILDPPPIKGNKIAMSESDLIKRLEYNDLSVRFVPFGFKVGELSHTEISKNPYVIGLAGEEGAENLAELSSRYRLHPTLWSYENVEEPQTRVSAIGTGWADSKFLINGSSDGSNTRGAALIIN